MASLARYCMRIARLCNKLEVVKGRGNFQYYRTRPVCYWYTTDLVLTNDTETATVATKLGQKKARKSTNKKSRVLSTDELEPAIEKKQRKSTKEGTLTFLDSHAAAPENGQKLDKKIKTRKSKKEKDKSTDDVVKKKRKRVSKAEKLQDSPSEDTATVDKKRKGRRKKVKDIVEEKPDEKLGPFIPFEGTVVSSDVSHTFHSIDKHNLSEGRFYSLQSATENYLFPSVTTILDNTMDSSSSFRLLIWKHNLIKLHGKKDFETIAKDTLNSGANFHKMLENWLVQKNPELDSESSPLDVWTIHAKRGDEGVCDDDRLDLGRMQSVEHVLKDDDRLDLGRMQSVEHVLKDISEVKALEMTIAHIPLGYTGTFDCLAVYKGILCLIDWKTSKKPKPTLEDCYDYPLQAVAYAGAINQDPSINFKVLNVLIVVVYETGEPAHAHFIDQETCEKYWLKWTLRLQSYQTQFSEDLSEIIN